MWISLTLPRIPALSLAAALRSPDCSEPWLPICVAALELAASSAILRASQIVLVNGFWV